VTGVTAFAIVGSLLLEEGVNAFTQEQTTRSAAHRTARISPAEPIVPAAVGGVTLPVVRTGLPRTVAVSLGELPGPYDRELARAEQTRYPLRIAPALALAPIATDTTVKAASSAAGRADRRRYRRRSRWRIAPNVTWYGPGFYGNRTACGIRYGRWLRGVAHRTLPCGTMIKLRWRGLTTRVPVVDRGPYSGRHVVFDLTAAVACRDLKPRRVRNACFTRHNVHWRVDGKVKLARYFRARRR
jgi:hypothetical protein